MKREELATHLWWHYPVLVRRPRFLVAAFPKSGGTYLAQVIAGLTGGLVGFAGQIPGRNEQDLAPFWPWRHQFRTVVAHMHVRYHPQTQVYIDHFRMMPIVCVRNLADVVPSVVDHWRQNATPDGASWPFAHVHPHLMKQSDEALYDFVAVHVMPWYVNFFVSWARSRYRNAIISYEQVFAPGASGVIDLARSLGFDAPQAEAAIAAAGARPTRLNVGKAGRGAQLPHAVLDKIDKALSFYPDIDWSPVWSKAS